jgi:hypothetical protein
MRQCGGPPRFPFGDLIVPVLIGAPYRSSQGEPHVTGNPTRLLRLVDREFRELTGAPARTQPPPRFKALKLDPARFDNTWDRKRGAAVRLMAVVLREDQEALARRVCESEATAKTYAGAAEWLQRESAHLRKIARLLDTAGGRLAAVVSWCGDSAPAQ